MIRDAEADLNLAQSASKGYAPINLARANVLVGICNEVLPYWIAEAEAQRKRADEMRKALIDLVGLVLDMGGNPKLQPVLEVLGWSDPVSEEDEK